MMTDFPLQNPATPPGWEIDMSTGTPILMFEKCSVIQDEQAHFVFRLISEHIALRDEADYGAGDCASLKES